MFSKKSIAAVAILVVALGLLLACAAEEEEATPTPAVEETPTAGVETPEASPTPAVVETPAVAGPKYGGILPYYQSGDPPHFDPFLSVSYLIHPQTSAIYDKLIGISYGVPRYKEYMVPELAESWDMPDNVTYVFHLRKGVKFSDEPPVNGRELTCEDVKWSLERRTQSGCPLLYTVKQLDKVECPDKYTVKVTMKAPFAPFMNFVCSSYMTVLPHEIEEEYGDFKRWDVHKGCGTGPWCLEEYMPNVRIVYKKNPNYYKKDADGNPIPYLDGYNLSIIPDPSTRIAALRSGQIYGYGPPLEEVESIKGTNPELCYREDAPLGLSLIYMRTDKPPFDDVRVRQAVALSIDQDEIIETIYGGKGEKFTLLPGLWRAYRLEWDQLGEGSKYLTHDVELAKKLLAEAGYPDGFDTTLNSTTVYGTTHVDTLELIADYLNIVGIRAKIVLHDYGAYIANVYVGKYEGMAYGPLGESGDPDGYLTTMHDPGEMRNSSHVNDPVINELLVKQVQATDPAERIEIIHELQKYAAVQNYYVYRAAGYTYFFWQPWLKNHWDSYLGYDYGHARAYMWIDRESPGCEYGPGRALKY